MTCKSETEWGGAPKKSPLVQATVRSALQPRSMNTDQGRCEGILQQALSVTHPVCLCDHYLRSGCFIFYSLSHTHAHTHIHTLLPQRYQRRPGAGVCPCQKSDRCSNRKSKNQRPIIPIIRYDTLLMSGSVRVTGIWI